MIAHAMLLVLLFATAQSTTATSTQKESAVISGVVVDLDSGTPLRAAVVSLNPPYGRGISRTVTTDGAGLFEFANLPGGEYVLSVTRPGYIPTNFGEQRLGGPGATITVGDNERRDEVAIPMYRGGTISGRVFNEHGDAMPGVLVHAMTYRFHDGKRQLQSVFADRTDDRGDFRLFTLPIGEYYVFADPRPTIGAIALGGPPPAIGMLAAFAGSIGTYYPNSPTPARAKPLNVVSAREISSVNIALATGKLARVRGRAVSATGEALSRVSLVTKGGFGGTMTTGVVREDGWFELPNIVPGEYVVTARSGPEPDAEVARLEITVAGDVDDLLLVGGRGGMLRGTITTDNGEVVPLPAARFSIRLEPVVSERGSPPGVATVQPDYTFEVKDLVGSFRLMTEVTPAAGHWATKAIRWRGDDVTHRAFEFRNGEVIDGVEVVLSERWATLSGVVRDDRNAPVGDTPLLLFPADETLWIPGSRYIRRMRTDRDGRYGASTLFAGNYLLAVAADIDTRSLDDVAFLRSLAERAAQVSLKDEDDLVFDLRVARSP